MIKHMQLLVVRHGIAEAFGPDGSDASRRLTPEGIEKTRGAARGLAFLGPRPTVLFTSPRVRAAETARLIGEAFDVVPQVLKSLGEGSPTKVLEDLIRHRKDAMCIVGHEPVLSRLVELACGAARPGGFIEMKKAGCACLELTMTEHGLTQPGQLLWLATPRMLRKMG
jgi:phosphohistidine phosphatase